MIKLAIVDICQFWIPCGVSVQRIILNFLEKIEKQIRDDTILYVNGTKILHQTEILAFAIA